MATFSCIEDLPLFRYGLIMADPPWRYELYSEAGEKKSPQAHYDCMSLSEIKDLPIPNLAAPDAILWLWATNPMLPQALELMDAWRFTFKTAGHWSKKTRHGKQAFGPGYIFRGAGEPYLIGTIGRPRYASRSVRSVIEGVVREHSRKPEEAYAAAEQLAGDVPKLDLFSRQVRPGWDAFGDEVGKFEYQT